MAVSRFLLRKRSFRVVGLATFWVLIPAACLFAIFLPGFPETRPQPDQIGMMVTLAHPTTEANVSVNTSYEASTATGVESLNLNLVDGTNKSAIASIQVWFRNGDRTRSPWKCAFYRSLYHSDNTIESVAQTPRDFSLASAKRLTDAGAAARARALLSDQTWQYPFDFGADFEPSTDSALVSQVGVATEFICSRKLEGSLVSSRTPAVAAPLSDVVILDQHEATQSLRYDISYPVSWSLESISRGNDLGGGSILGPSLIVNPGEISEQLSPSHVSDGGFVSIVAPSPNVVFMNPQAQQRADIWVQFGLLLLGAWLGIIGGVLSERLLKDRRRA